MDKEKINRLKKLNLALFLETGDSFENWDKVGLLSRELKLYNRLSEYVNKIYLFTYGINDKKYQKLVNKNVFIVQKPLRIKNQVYEFLLPFIHCKVLKTCGVYKTNQNMAGVPASISKVLFSKNKFIARSGYLATHYNKDRKLPYSLKLRIRIIEGFSYILCDKIFIPTKQICKFVQEKYPFVKDKLVMMNNFIDTNQFKRKIMKKKYDIIYVARLNQIKNHLELLRAVKELKLSICFIGQGEEEKNILNFANENNIDLKLIGRISNEDLPRCYNSSRVCVFPSLHEGNPKTLLEAMSCELPIIGCNVTGVENLIKNKQNGLLCEPNAESLRKTIRYLFKNKKLWNKLGKNAREMIINEFSLDSLVIRELEEYAKMIK